MSNNFPNDLNSANSFPCVSNGPYGPMGFNDNNFNRKAFPSNIYPNHNTNGTNGTYGMTGNPFGNYNPLSTNTQSNMNNLPSMTSFDKAFAQHDPIIERMNYTNQNNLIHNNVAPIVLDENIVEYRLFIDSVDRDIQTYPNPFNFTVHFNGLARGGVRTEIQKYGKTVAVNEYFPGTPGPLINKEFKNVKYIRLESIVLPQFAKYTQSDQEHGKFIPDEEHYLPDDRFIALVINELTDESLYLSTGDSGNNRIDHITKNNIIPPKPFEYIFPDNRLGRKYYTGKTYGSASRIYQKPLLGNIKKLTLQLYDSYGNLLSYDHINKHVDKTVDITDIRHPLNKNIQVNYTFVIGVVESMINTNVKYEI